jgi:hypothetical protein
MAMASWKTWKLQDEKGKFKIPDLNLPAPTEESELHREGKRKISVGTQTPPTKEKEVESHKYQIFRDLSLPPPVNKEIDERTIEEKMLASRFCYSPRCGGIKLLPKN